MQRIAANSVLPARREEIELGTDDGLSLVGELALPRVRPPRATIICVHPLPVAGGNMDSHLFRKAAWRLPALADLAVLRFNTRGTTSPLGTSEGEFANGFSEGLDVAAAVEFAASLGLPVPWLVGWSFGADVIVKHPQIGPVQGAVLISPPLRFADDDDLRAWAATGRPVSVLVPEFDDFLAPEAAAGRFAAIEHAHLIVGQGAKHLWVGEPNVRVVLDEIVRVTVPEALDPDTGELSTVWAGVGPDEQQRWSDL